MNRMGPSIDRYAAGGTLLSYATSGLSRAHETARPGPGAWSIAEVVAHLLDCDLVHADRMKRVIAEDEPILHAFDENRWIERLDSQSIPVEEAVHLFAAHRRWMTRLLRHCSEDDFRRVGLHTEVGRKSLADLVVTAVGHVDHHLRFLFAKRAGLGIALVPHYSDDASVARREPGKDRDRDRP